MTRDELIRAAIAAESKVSYCVDEDCAARRALEACGTTEAVAASLSGTPSPIPGDTPK
jgi:hypothetical protein